MASLYLLALCLICLPASGIGQSNGDCPQVSDDCFEPTGTDCAWFERCLNVRIPCGITYPNYAINGLRLCDLYSTSSSDSELSDSGLQTIQTARKCLQSSLASLLNSNYCHDPPSCLEVKKMAMEAQVPCYSSLEKSESVTVCDLPCEDYARVFWTFKNSIVGQINDTEAKFQALEATGCVSKGESQCSLFSKPKHVICQDAFTSFAHQKHFRLEVELAETFDRQTACPFVQTSSVSDNELSYCIVDAVSELYGWSEGTTVDWHTVVHSFDSSRSTISIELFMVDRVSIGLMEVAQSSGKMRLSQVIQQLRFAITGGLNISVGVEGNLCTVESIMEQYLDYSYDSSDIDDSESESGESDTSEKSDTSEESDKSDTSDKSEKSEKSDTSEESDKSDTSEESDKSDTSEKSEKSEKSDTSEKSEKSEKSDTSEKSEKSEKSDTSDTSAKSAKAQKSGEDSGDSEKSDKTGDTEDSGDSADSEKSEKSGDTEDSGDNEKSEKSEKTGDTEDSGDSEKTGDTEDSGDSEKSEKSGDTEDSGDSEKSDKSETSGEESDNSKDSDDDDSDGGNPKPPPVLPSQCYVANITDCAWYKRCLEVRFPCRNHQTKYAIRYGRKFCELYSSESLSIDGGSFQWIDSVRQCIQKVFDPLLHRCQSDPSCDQIQSLSDSSFQACYTQPPGGESVCQVGVSDWYRIFWDLKASLTTSFASVSRNMLSTSLECGGAYQEQIGNSFYSITLKRRQVTSEESKSDDEMAHEVSKYISEKFHWEEETTVDWYAFAAESESQSESQSDDDLQVQMFLVDREEIGLMTASEAENRLSLDETVTQLSEAISNGLVIELDDEAAQFDVTAMRQCTSGASDVSADCSDGTVLASTEEQSWWSENSTTVITVSVVFVFVYVVFL